MAKTPPNSNRALLKHLRPKQKEMVRLLKSLVEIESPSTDTAAVARVARALAKEWKRRGAKVQLLPRRGAGPIFRAELVFGNKKPKGQLLVLGHMDTVYAIGHLKRAPFKVKGGRAYGPGTYDMKAGLVQALFAIDALKALKSLGQQPSKKVVLLFTSDEEIGSHSSRALIEQEARKSDAVFVLEPSLGPRGALKTARKGVGTFEVIVQGHAAHSGIEPEKGVNAIHELAEQIIRIQSWARPARGLTLHANIIAGGGRSNVVAESARAIIDVRLPRLRDGKLIEERMRSLYPVDRRAKITVRGGVNRPPLERTTKVARAFRHAQSLAKEMGLKLEEASTGGGSDGNFTGALGIPTLDGLGGVGAGAHTKDEYIRVKFLPERAALLAALLLTS